MAEGDAAEQAVATAVRHPGTHAADEHAAGQFHVAVRAPQLQARRAHPGGQPRRHRPDAFWPRASHAARCVRRRRDGRQPRLGGGPGHVRRRDVRRARAAYAADAGWDGHGRCAAAAPAASLAPVPDGSHAGGQFAAQRVQAASRRHVPLRRLVAREAGGDTCQCRAHGRWHGPFAERVDGDAPRHHGKGRHGRGVRREQRRRRGHLQLVRHGRHAHGEWRRFGCGWRFVGRSLRPRAAGVHGRPVAEGRARGRVLNAAALFRRSGSLGPVRDRVDARERQRPAAICIPRRSRRCGIVEMSLGTVLACGCAICSSR
mmetsp:Transcript_4269/g.11335  ORF Transcript_4269/g.11335 Transcript_4269/m.11335 type:complete len:316 (-) Transcript_4269:619-1566(-)